MANEINWLRSNAKHLETEIMTINAEDAAAVECQPGTYKIERYGFTGNLPYRMAKALQGCKSLIKTDEESEVLHLGTGYRGGEGRCRYYRTTYTRVAA